MASVSGDVLSVEGFVENTTFSCWFICTISGSLAGDSSLLGLLAGVILFFGLFMTPYSCNDAMLVVSAALVGETSMFEVVSDLLLGRIGTGGGPGGGGTIRGSRSVAFRGGDADAEAICWSRLVLW